VKLEPHHLNSHQQVMTMMITISSITKVCTSRLTHYYLHELVPSTLSLSFDLDVPTIDVMMWDERQISSS
jgi:hypothetical protein